MTAEELAANPLTAEGAKKPWEITRDEFYRTHTREKPGYSSYAEGQRLSELPPDTRVWVWHATSDETAKELAEKGINPSGKPSNLARRRYERGEYAEFAPGRGLAGGIYVGATPQTVEGFGSNLLAMKVRLGDLDVPPEQSNLGVKKGTQALASGDAVITKPIDPQDIVHFGRSNRYPAHAHQEFVRHALDQGKPVPAEVLADYPHLVTAKPATLKTEPEGRFLYHSTALRRNVTGGRTPEQILENIRKKGFSGGWFSKKPVFEGPWIAIAKDDLPAGGAVDWRNKDYIHPWLKSMSAVDPAKFGVTIPPEKIYLADKTGRIIGRLIPEKK